MKKEITRRGKIRAFSYAATVFSVLLVFAIAGNVRAAHLQRQVRLSGERALCELDTYLTTIYTDLQKGRHQTPRQVPRPLRLQAHRSLRQIPAA